MKYTKTVPYFKKGDKVKKRVEVGNTGKTKEEIMAEARRNQAIEKKAQAADAEKAKTANNVSKPKKDLSGTSSKAKTAVIVGPVDTGKSSAGKSSTGKSSTGKSSTGKSSTKVEQSTSPWIARPVTDRYGNIIQGPAAESKAMETPVQLHETPVPEQRRTDAEQHAIDVSRLPRIDDEALPEPVKTGGTYINEAGEKKPLEANRFIWPSGIDNTFLATTDNGEHIFQRDIHNGDTIYVNRKGEPPAASELPLYKKIFANADKKI